MGIGSESCRQMDRRALLTEREREVLRGEAEDVENPEQYRSKIRSRLKNRIPKLLRDLELLEAAEPELTEQVREEFCGRGEEGPLTLEERIERLENELERVRENGR